MKRSQQATAAVNEQTRRQKSYLERLKEKEGRRVVVDLNKSLAECLDALVAVGYGESQAQVIRRALQEVHAATCSDDFSL